MSFETCLWAAQAQKHHKVQDLSPYYKDMLAFFWIISRSQETRSEVEPILENYHTVERIAEKQDTLDPQIDVETAHAALALDSTLCIQKHKWLRKLYILQTPMDTSCTMAMTYAPRDYYAQWLKKRNQHTKV